MAKRKDAVEIKMTDPFHMIVPYVMPKRTEAEVSSREHFDVTKTLKYIDKVNKTKNEDTKLKLFHCICYVWAKTIYLRPKMNVFIAGRKFWQRNDISLSFVAKQKFEDNAQEALLFMTVNPEWTLADISKYIIGDVKKARKENGNDLDKTMKFIGSLPRPILVFIFWVVSRLEYHGIMPDALSKGDPNYSTLLLSNLGSIGAGAPYHHLSNYGTCSMMCTIGTMEKDENTKKTILPMTVIFDERIGDGFYFAKSLRIGKYLFEHPEEFEKPIFSPIDVEF